MSLIYYNTSHTDFSIKFTYSAHVNSTSFIFIFHTLFSTFSIIQSYISNYIFHFKFDALCIDKNVCLRRNYNFERSAGVCLILPVRVALGDLIIVSLVCGVFPFLRLPTQRSPTFPLI